MKLSENGSRHTLCVHAGAGPDPLTGAVMTPVYLTSTYAQRIPGEHKGYEYSRTKNPTRSSLEKALASLEGARYAYAFASGLAAEDAVLRLLAPGDAVVGGLDLYGGTFRLMKRVWGPFGIQFTFIDTTLPGQAARALSPAVRMIWIETPSNPLLKITDIREIVRAARAKKILVVVDNTFATPILQRPLSLGADVVIHSTTKYIGGHSDVVGGAVLTNRGDLAERLSFYQNAAGAVPGPLDCFLLLRGIKTLALRMKAHNQGASAVSSFLARHKKIQRLYYPGRGPAAAAAKKQMAGFGGMVSFDLRGGRRGAMRFFSRLRIFTVGESLGGVESLACYPWTMTHASIPENARRDAGISENLVRLSVGVEDPQDLIADLRQAL